MQLVVSHEALRRLALKTLNLKFLKFLNSLHSEFSEFHAVTKSKCRTSNSLGHCVDSFLKWYQPPWQLSHRTLCLVLRSRAEFLMTSILQQFRSGTRPQLLAICTMDRWRYFWPPHLRCQHCPVALANSQVCWAWPAASTPFAPSTPPK